MPQNWQTAPLPAGSYIVIFLKLFDPETQTLKGINHVYMKKNYKVSDLAPVIVTAMDWPPNTVLKLYEVCYYVTLKEYSLAYISRRKSNPI